MQDNLFNTTIQLSIKSITSATVNLDVDNLDVLKV